MGEKGTPLPPCSLPAIWRLTDIRPIISKAKKHWVNLKYVEAANLCNEIITKAKQAQELLRRAAVESKYLLEQEQPPDGVFTPTIDYETGEVLNKVPKKEAPGKN